MPGKGSDQDRLMDCEPEKPDDGEWEEVGCGQVLGDILGVLLVVLVGLGYLAVRFLLPAVVEMTSFGGG